jgi:hypothetical protein
MNPPGALRLAGLLVRFRLRTLWNATRARGRGRTPTLAVAVAFLAALAYVAMFRQAFATIVGETDLGGQIAALVLVTGAIAFGNLTAKAASSEAVLAGSPENEFLLSRPIGLSTLVTARCLADAVTDPFGALFLFPVLLAAAQAWRRPASAYVVAAASSVAAQIAIGALAQATQIALVRFLPRARRRAAWTALRLLAALALASLWMTGTWVLREPAALGRALEPLARYTALSPSTLIVGPLAAAADPAAGAGAVALALGRLLAATTGALWLASAVARRAGARGWEEAGASWAEAGARPEGMTVGAPRGRLLTAATKDLRLITRDRAQLLALVAMPVIFVGVQLFGAIGWTWSTASLQRVAYLAFSLTLYMATIGPLAHMQAERRAFWILRAVPVPVGRLLAAKARAWSVIVGGIAAVAFAGLSLGAPVPSAGAWLSTAALVVAGAVGMTWFAVAHASHVADLSDDQRPAISPMTIYSFLLVGGLYNVILSANTTTRIAGLVLYAFALGASWIAGVQQAAVCLDPEATRARRLTLADGASMVVIYALGLHAVSRLADQPELGIPGTVTVAYGFVMAVLAAAAIGYLLRRPAGPARMGKLPSAAAAVGAGLAAGGALAALAGRGASPPAPQIDLAKLVLMQAIAIACQETIFRGVVQRGIEDLLEGRRWGRAAAAAASVTLALVATILATGATTGDVASIGAGVGGVGMTGAIPTVTSSVLAAVVATHTAPAVARAITGRVGAAVLARAVAIGLSVGLALAVLPRA